MKLSTAIILIALSLSLQALPPDVEQLIQTDKFKEALERVNALLREKPGDVELEDTRKELQNVISPAASRATAPAPGPVPEAVVPQPQALPPVTAKQLDLILADVNRATGEARKAPLNELFNATGPLVTTHPDIMNLWAMRGLAALELSRTDAAKEAEANLLRLGADRNGNEQVLTLLAMLARKRVSGASTTPDTQASSSTLLSIPPSSFDLNPPPQGYFGLHDLFANGPYVEYNSHSRTSILQKAQEKFKEAGLYASKADGVPGPGTQKAILAYQNAQGLLASGRLDDATVATLGLTGISQTNPPVSPGGGSGSRAGRASGSRSEMMEELARLEAQQNQLFSIAMTIDRNVISDRLDGYDTTADKARADRIFANGQALELRIDALRKALGVRSASSSSNKQQKPTGNSMNDFRNRAARFDDL